MVPALLAKQTKGNEVPSFYDPTTLYGTLVVAAAALRETAQLRTAIATLCAHLEQCLAEGYSGEESVLAALNAARAMVQSDDIGGGRSIGYMLVLATKLDVDAERIAVRSPAVRKLRAKLDPGWANRHTPSASDSVHSNHLPGGDREEARDTYPGVGPDSPSGS